VLSPNYFRVKWSFDFILEKNDALRISILVAGIAFAINEHFDKILLEWLDVSKEDIGAACYKIGMFMVLFRNKVYTLGIEPFSSH
jgi:hypothetical protein